MRLLRLLITTSALTLFATGIAGNEEPHPTTTLSCSAAIPSVSLGCFIERPVFVLGSIEVAFGVDARAVLTDFERSSLAPYGILGLYEPSWSAWVEVALPNTRVPVLGRPDFLRVGFTWRF